MSLANLSKLRILDVVAANLTLSSIQMAVFITVLIEIVNFINRKRLGSNFFPGFYSILLSPVRDSTTANGRNSNSKQERKEAAADDDDDRIHVYEGDLVTVLRSLGLFSDGEGSIPARLDADDVFDMFEEEGVNSCEMRGAFEVFDEDGDGFIEARELQKVLCALGLGEGLDVERCRRMIGAFDENGDGKIDFDEFVKFMRNSF